MRPFYAEGSKTLGYEAVEQLGWRAPDHCVVPAASGELHTKIWKGIQEMADVGLIDCAKTRMHLAQPEGSSPIVEAFRTGNKRVRPVKPDTIAKSLAIGNPASGAFAMEVLAETGGSAVAALEEEVEEGIRLLAETEGIFTETAGGVVIAGLRRLVKECRIKRDEVTVAYVTGNGFKTIEVVAGSVRTINTSPSCDAFEEANGGPARSISDIGLALYLSARSPESAVLPLRPQRHARLGVVTTTVRRHPLRQPCVPVSRDGLGLRRIDPGFVLYHP